MALPEAPLEPIEDPQVSKRYLRYAVELRELVTCLLPGTEIAFPADAVAFQENELLLELEPGPGALGALNYEQLEQLRRPQAPLRLSYGVSSVLVFAHARMVQFGERLTVSVDQPVYKLQRRDALRLRVHESHGAAVELHGLDFPLHDLSAGGLSVLVPLVDESLFAMGKQFPETRLSFQGKQWPIGLAVTSVTPLKLKAGPALKVGFRLLDLPPALEREIAKEAYLLSHRIWSRWL